MTRLILQCLDDYHPDSEEVRKEKLILARIVSDAAATLKFVQFNVLPHTSVKFNAIDDSDEEIERKRLLARLDRLWYILKPADAVKLNFKFIISVYPLAHTLGSIYMF